MFTIRKKTSHKALGLGLSKDILILIYDILRQSESNHLLWELALGGRPPPGVNTLQWDSWWVGGGGGLWCNSRAPRPLRMAADKVIQLLLWGWHWQTGEGDLLCCKVDEYVRVNVYICVWVCVRAHADAVDLTSSMWVGRVKSLRASVQRWRERQQGWVGVC